MMYGSMCNFYEQLDIVFDKMYEKYGLNNELIQLKSCILSAYDEEYGYIYEHVYRSIRSRSVYIDENGYVKTSD